MEVKQQNKFLDELKMLRCWNNCPSKHAIKFISSSHIRTKKTVQLERKSVTITGFVSTTHFQLKKHLIKSLMNLISFAFGERKRS